MKNKKYTFKSLKQIDPETIDYLKFVMPTNDLESEPIENINTFLNKLDEVYSLIESER